MMWGILWRSQNRLDGKTERLVGGVPPVVFQYKREAASYIKEHYGYIANRADLRVEPHGWRMPKPVRVRLVRA